jgi:hypothetical protein
MRICIPAAEPDMNDMVIFRLVSRLETAIFGHGNRVFAGAKR